MQVGSVSRFLGQATNNEAEYTALILGLTAAHALGVHRLHVLGDSKLVIEQARSCRSSGRFAAAVLAEYKHTETPRAHAGGGAMAM